MASNLLKNGHKVNGFNRTKGAAEKIKHENFTFYESPKDVCEKSGIIITCVSNDNALGEVLFGHDGVFVSINKNKILVDCSTVSIEMTERIAEECSRKNAKFIDAPITGSKNGAENGTLMFMVGGEKKLVGELMPVFQSMGTRIVYCGKTTMGQKAKFALNLAQALMLQSYIEAMTLGVKNGVPIQSMMEIFENSGAKSNVGSIKLPKIMKRDFEQHFKLELMNKDLGLAMKEMIKLDLELPLTKELIKVFEKAMKMHSQEDWSAIVKVLEENSGIVLK